MSETHESPRLFLRLTFGEGHKFGPGKAELLERIDRTGSISGAGREMNMSYKRAWSLVEEMNALFREPLIESSRGGAGGGGARLTQAGAAALAAYRALEITARTAGDDQIAVFRSLMRDMSGGK